MNWVDQWCVSVENCLNWNTMSEAGHFMNSNLWSWSRCKSVCLVGSLEHRDGQTPETQGLHQPNTRGGRGTAARNLLPVPKNFFLRVGRVLGIIRDLNKKTLNASSSNNCYVWSIFFRAVTFPHPAPLLTVAAFTSINPLRLKSKELLETIFVLSFRVRKAA